MALAFNMAMTWLVGYGGPAAEPPRRPEGQSLPIGDAIIRGKASSSEIVVTIADRPAGAIHSLRWNGKELLDSYYHGRQLKSAASFDCAQPGEFWAECYNLTEAGSRADETWSKSAFTNVINCSGMVQEQIAGWWDGLPRPTAAGWTAWEGHPTSLSPTWTRF
jgi:hypothetical protein